VSAIAQPAAVPAAKKASGWDHLKSLLPYVWRYKGMVALGLLTLALMGLVGALPQLILGIITLSRVSVLDAHDKGLLLVALTPLAALIVVLLAPVLIPPAAVSRFKRLQGALAGMRRSLLRLREGLHVFRHPRSAALATTAQLGAWTLQWLSCWLLLMALGLDSQAGAGAAAAVLFAVNVTAVIPATPANVGVFQAACVAVLAGAYHVSTPEAIAYGIVLQAVELATALLMGLPALLNEGLSWRDVRLRTMHAAPIKLPALPSSAVALASSTRSRTSALNRSNETGPALAVSVSSAARTGANSASGVPPATA